MTDKNSSSESLADTATITASTVIQDEFRSFQSKTRTGFGTAHGYFSRKLPEAFRLMEDPVLGTEADLGALTVKTLDEGWEVIVVEAPPALKARGIPRTLAFPIGVLNRFYR